MYREFLWPREKVSLIEVILCKVLILWYWRSLDLCTNLYSDKHLNKWILIRDLSRCKLVMSSSSNSKHRNFDICDLEFVKIDCLLIVRSLAPHVSHAIHEEGYVERNAETKVEVHPEGCPDRFWPEVARHADRKSNG